ncbi:hypothetical protein [Mucisphaera sp.]|uniref:hypothetical protein n=1 Tax=Mucisphaera sp. TaxID=2913024 RepID=UPI003D101D9B
MSYNWQTEITDFWVWFASEEALLRQASELPEVVHLISDRVDQLGDFDWEIGPDSDRTECLFFALSPGRCREKLSVTRRIVELAPDVDGWIFRHAKPRKAWFQRFTLPDSEGVTHVLDGSTATYALVRFGEDDYDVYLSSDCFEVLPVELRQDAAELFGGRRDR